MSDEAAADNVVTSGRGPGGLLRMARERRGLGEREAADLLNLPCRFVTAMEQDEFDKLPADIFARGYLRAYSRLLEIDSDEVLARYKQVMPAEPAQVEGSRRAHSRAWNLDPTLVFGGLAVLVLMLVVVAAWSLFGPAAGGLGGADGATDAGASRPFARAGQELTADRNAEGAAAASNPSGFALSVDDDNDVDAPANITINANANADAGAGAAAADAGADAEDVLVLDDADADDEPLRTPPDSGAAAQAGRAQSSSGTPTAGSLAAAGEGAGAAPAGPGARQRSITRDGNLIRIDTGAGADILTLNYREDCWTEISSASGTALFQDLVRSGRTVRVNGSGPFRILLGYAPAATVNLNGQDVNLAPHTRDGVAILVVGQ